jgi:probable addiction module antidote protein
MSAIAERAGLGRESLYKALAPGAKPRYDTVLKGIRRKFSCRSASYFDGLQ